MRRQRVWIVVAATLLLVAGTGQAQEKGHVAGVFGWTFGEETDNLYRAQFGVGISDTIQIVGSFERMSDVLTGRYALLLRDISVIGNLDITGKCRRLTGASALGLPFPEWRRRRFSKRLSAQPAPTRPASSSSTEMATTSPVRSQTSSSSCLARRRASPSFSARGCDSTLARTFSPRRSSSFSMFSPIGRIFVSTG